MIVSIPIFNDKSANFLQNINLGGVNYNIDLVWNVIDERWIMSLSNNEYRIDSVPLVVNYPLFEQYAASCPNLNGDFFVQKNTTEDVELNFENLGKEFLLLWFDKNEVIEWKDENGMG